MKFKGIIFDLDGTAIPNIKGGKPSNELKELIKKAQKSFVVSIATGRVYHLCENLLKELSLKHPCVISGGTQVVDPISGNVLWEKLIEEESLEEILNILKPYSYEIFFSDDPNGRIASQKLVSKERFINIKYIGSRDSENIMKQLKLLTNIVAHKVSSWKKGTFDIHITNSKATKDHAIKFVLEKLSLKKEEVIGVGDSDNDLPIFDSVGFKVAMGNSTKALKEKADYIGLTVDEDGLVEIITKKLLNQVL